jgi:endonuclease/exonuclease/phosphatase family metal-dependent hydrolase
MWQSLVSHTAAQGGREAAVASLLAAVLTEIYLCDVCSCQELLRRNGRGQVCKSWALATFREEAAATAAIESAAAGALTVETKAMVGQSIVSSQAVLVVRAADVQRQLGQGSTGALRQINLDQEQKLAAAARKIQVAARSWRSGRRKGQYKVKKNGVGNTNKKRRPSVKIGV